MWETEEREKDYLKKGVYDRNALSICVFKIVFKLFTFSFWKIILHGTMPRFSEKEVVLFPHERNWDKKNAKLQYLDDKMYSSKKSFHKIWAITQGYLDTEI